MDVRSSWILRLQLLKQTVVLALLVGKRLFIVPPALFSGQEQNDADFYQGNIPISMTGI